MAKDKEKGKDELRVELEKKRKEEVTQCGKEIEETLKKYECVLHYKMSITDDGRIFAMPRILPLEAVQRG